jgi:hypothetical protein
MSVASIPHDKNRSIGLVNNRDAIDVHSLIVHELKSAWDRP